MVPFPAGAWVAAPSWGKESLAAGFSCPPWRAGLIVGVACFGLTGGKTLGQLLSEFAGGGSSDG